jgi:hypothetical protein
MPAKKKNKTQNKASRGCKRNASRKPKWWKLVGSLSQEQAEGMLKAIEECCEVIDDDEHELHTSKER